MICLIFSLAACGSNTNDALAGSEQQTAGDQQERSGEELGSFNKSASLDETVMVDENGVKITATGLNYTDHSVDLELSIENMQRQGFIIQQRHDGISLQFHQWVYGERWVFEL